MIRSKDELDKMRRAGRVVAEIHEVTRAAIRPGVTTMELNNLAADVLAKRHARSNFLNYHGFPAVICTSPNDMVVHGIPGECVLEEGDIISIDAGAIVEGYHGDAAYTAPVGEVSAVAKRLMEVTERSLWAGIDKLVVGERLHEVGRAIQSVAEAAGYSVVRTNSLQLTSINLNGINVPISSTFAPISGFDEFATNVDLRPAQNLFINVEANLDPVGRVMTWTFSSIDPATGLPPTDPTIGFLPPGGSGSLAFALMPNTGIATGTTINDQASVVFGPLPPLSTATWTNTIDNTPPVSAVTALPATESCNNFRVFWSGTDVGSGIGTYSIFVSDNGGAFAPWLTNTTETDAIYNGVRGHSYGFYSIATDLVGNVEPAKTSPDASTTVAQTGECSPPNIYAWVTMSRRTGDTMTATLVLRNSGGSDGFNVTLNSLQFLTLEGAGQLTLSSPTLPATVGSLASGALATIPLTITITPTVDKLMLVASGTIQDSGGNTYDWFNANR